MNPRERKRRRAENLRRPRTVMAQAFLKALFDWAARHADDNTDQITLPVGTVTTEELRRVVVALIAIRKEEQSRKPVKASR